MTFGDSMLSLSYWTVPLVGLLAGGFVVLVVWLYTRDFDRRYPDSPK